MADEDAERRDLLEWRHALQNLDKVVADLIDDPAPNVWPERRDTFEAAIAAEREAQDRYKAHWQAKTRNSQRW